MYFQLTPDLSSPLHPQIDTTTTTLSPNNIRDSEQPCPAETLEKFLIMPSSTNPSAKEWMPLSYRTDSPPKDFVSPGDRIPSDITNKTTSTVPQSQPPHGSIRIDTSTSPSVSSTKIQQRAFCTTPCTDVAHTTPTNIPSNTSSSPIPPSLYTQEYPRLPTTIFHSNCHESIAVRTLLPPRRTQYKRPTRFQLP